MKHFTTVIMKMLIHHMNMMDKQDVEKIEKIKPCTF